jgi:hypothetical protein
VAENKQQHGQDHGMMDQVTQTVGNVAEQVKKNDVAAWALGGAAGAVVGSVLGPLGTVAGAVGGAVLGDRWADSDDHGKAQGRQHQQQAQGGQAAQGAQAAVQAQGQQAASPRQVLQAMAQSCEQVKNHMVSQMNQIPDPQARTVYQMAINAVNNCVVECNTALGGIQ